MKPQNPWTPPVRIVILELLLAAPLFAQETLRAGIGLPQDWSARHVVFTNGGSPAATAAAARDPRAWFHWLRHTTPQFRQQSATAGSSSLRISPRAPGVRARIPAPQPSLNSRIDWAVSLGTNGGMALGETPAKFSFNVDETPDCQNDFVVFAINASPATGVQANIVALNNLYSGPAPNLCGTSPTFLWSYAVGNGAITLSPALSLDGKKVAFIEAASPRPRFDVLTWVRGQGRNATAGAVAPGSGGSAVTRLDYTNISVAGCAANPAADTNSSPYIDYDADAAYVGADNGVLYRIKGIFRGTPALDYCISVNAGRRLSSPVFDAVSGKVFVSDGQSVYAFTPGAGSFVPAGSIQIAGKADSILLSPIVDSTSGFVYVFSNHDLSNTNAIVSQMPVSLAARVDVPIGPATNAPILDGDFDNKYYELGPSSGTLYACGTQTGASSKPALYALMFQPATGVLNPAPAMANNKHINSAANPSGTCSPLIEFFDGTTDRLFDGVGRQGAINGANLVTMWDITQPIASSSTTPAAFAANELGGTSAFAVDNLSPLPQASSIYFGTLAKGNSAPCGVNLFCAVKLTQQALK